MNVRALALSAYLAAWVCGPLLVFAGTTGGLSGHVVDATTGVAIADARVSISAPSQSLVTATDAHGFFAVASLSPDTYVVSVQRPGYEPVSEPGTSVFADQTTHVYLRMSLHIREIAHVSSRRTVVQPGATSNLTSLGTAALEATQALGGPGGVGQTYGAMASVPGIYSPQGQTGWYQTLYIRGGDQDQVGYEFDGIPVARRDWQNAPLVNFSRMGVGELQVYTGGIPSTSDATGISGYVNQVVKRGSAPAYVTLRTDIGFPNFTHGLQIEAGNATPRFSYYLGALALNSTYRYVDQRNGAGLSKSYFFPVQLQNPGATQTFFDTGQQAWNGSPGFVAAPGNVYGIATTWDRENVANLHWSIPHRGASDDVQLLLMESLLANDFYSALSDYGGPWTNVNGGAGLSWQDGVYYGGPIFAPARLNQMRVYPFPSSPAHAFGGALPASQRDYWTTQAAIEKLQYQRNFNTHAYLRAVAYSTYSDWLLNAPASQNFAYGLEAADWEPNTHTVGAIVSFVDQLTPKHFLTVSTSLEHTRTIGWSSVGLFGQTSTPITNLIDAQWNCYAPTTGYRDSCYDPNARGTIASPIPLDMNVACAAGGVLAGKPACANAAQWIVTESGANHLAYDVSPRFTSLAVNDEWRPADRWTINAGLRFERFAYRLSDTTSGYPARAFWYHTYSNEYCFGPAVQMPVLHGFSATGQPLPCPAGTGAAQLQQAPATTYAAQVGQPRVAFSYLLGSHDVVRGSYGVYARPPATSWMQYNSETQNLASFIGNSFLYYGFTSPNHLLRPDTSYNVDLSWEHEFKNGIAFKVSPYIRSTANQDQIFEYDAVLGLTSGLNVGHQVSTGVELLVQKGTFGQPGLNWRLTYTRTRSRIRYADFPSGRNVIDLINFYVKQYNAYTSACAGPSPNAALCGTTGAGLNPMPTTPQSALPAAPCYALVGGTPTVDATCALPNTVANPYWNAKPAPLFAHDGWYTTYDIFPAPFVGDNGYEVPDTATLSVQYVHRRWSVTPTLLYSSGASYGNPLTWPGYDPASCAPVAGTLAANPSTCTRAIFTPRSGGIFDGIGAFRQPWRFTANLQLGYELTGHARVSLSLMHVLDRCHQRGYPWDAPYVCTYTQLPSNVLPPVGNFATTVNPGPTQLRYPYAAWNSNLNTDYLGVQIPFQALLTVEMKL